MRYRIRIMRFSSFRRRIESSMRSIRVLVLKFNKVNVRVENLLLVEVRKDRRKIN